MEDLDDVRELRAQVEPTDVSVARTRHRVLSTLDTPAAVVPRRQRVLQIVSACAAAALVMGGVAVGISHARTSAAPIEVGAPPPSATTPDRTWPHPLPSTSTPTLPPGGQGSLVDMSRTPVVIPPGAYLYVKMGVDQGNRSLGESWYDPNGFIPACMIQTYRGQENVETDPASLYPEDRAAFAQEGPSLRHPTPAFLAALPTDRAALWALIRDQFSLTPPGDHRYDLVFKNATTVLEAIEPVLSPAVRAAMLDAFAHAPNASTDHTPRTYAGHNVYLVQQTTQDGASGFAVDTTSGRIVGYYAYGAGDSVTDDDSDHPEYAVVAQPCQRP